MCGGVKVTRKIFHDPLYLKVYLLTKRKMFIRIKIILIQNPLILLLVEKIRNAKNTKISFFFKW